MWSRDTCGRRQLRRREARWGAAGGERTARRMTNPFRRHGAASLPTHGEAWVMGPAGCVEATAKTTLGPITWLGAGCSDGEMKEAERPARRVRAGQESEPAQYRCGLRPEGTDRERTGQHKPVRGKVGRKGDAR